MAAIVLDKEMSQGHAPFIPPKVIVTATVTDVKIGTPPLPPIVIGDVYGPHCIFIPLPVCHTPIAVMGSTTVFANGIPVVRDGDPLSCGDAADGQVNRTVFADGGGNARTLLGAGYGPAAGTSAFVGAGETLGYTIADLTDSYPPIKIHAKTKIVRVCHYLGSPPVETCRDEIHWDRWCENNNFPPGGLTPPGFPSLGFTIHLKEEYTNKIYPSRRGIGAPSLPQSAPEGFKAPLDSMVSYKLEDLSYWNYNTSPMVGGNPVPPPLRATECFSIDKETGVLTFTRTAPLDPDNLPRKILGRVVLMLRPMRLGAVMTAMGEPIIKKNIGLNVPIKVRGVCPPLHIPSP